MKLICIIIDGEPLARKVPREFVREVDNLKRAGEEETPARALSILTERGGDMIFPHINMPNIDGFDSLKYQDGREHYHGHSSFRACR